MPPQPPTKQQSDGSDINQLLVLQPGEQVLCDIRRHPFGLIGVYVSSGLLALITIAVAIAVPQFVTGLSQQGKMALVAGAAIFLLFTMLYTYIAAVVYNGNRWIVTNDSITQITQRGLFSKETSQLSMANLEDVTVDQDSLVQTMFGFGTLRAESAGARGKFYFSFCPDPKGHARKVIEAHEAYIANKPEETVTANRPLATTTSFNQPWQPPAGPMPPAGGPQV
jgi:uncharacterized membrane protein YdbT with pleckstrin-like domain